jgi:tetratricopeptide (TPR) repeat protein
MGRAGADRGRRQASIRLLEQALETSRDQGARAWTLRTTSQLASQLAGQGRTEEAIRQLEIALADMSGDEHPEDLRRAQNLLTALR